MPSYDATDCDPPAPVAQVTLRNVHSGETVADVPLLLDTGADVTLLPRNTVEQLGVQLVAGPTLGRDILNYLTLLLDGPQQQWSEHSRC